MRTGKELISASKQFTEESKLRSWYEVVITILGCGLGLYITLNQQLPLVVRLIFSIMLGLFYVRVFVIYHDFAHRAILRKDKIADVIMNALGLYVLAPKTIWTRSHEHHHNNNSKLTMSGIGSYPTISKERFISLSKGEKRLYLINRHPLTVIFGYLTLFTYWLNLKSFIQSPKKHVDSAGGVDATFRDCRKHLVFLWIYFGRAECISSFLYYVRNGCVSFLCAAQLPRSAFCREPRLEV